MKIGIGNREKGQVGKATAECPFWHVGDVARCQILVRDAPNNGHADEAAKPKLMTQRVSRAPDFAVMHNAAVAGIADCAGGWRRTLGQGSSVLFFFFAWWLRRR